MIDLRQGDCLELMKTIPDKSIDMILCDLPYGTTACKWDNVIPFEPLWEQYNRIIKDNGAIVLFGSEPFSSALRMSNIKNYRYDWYWDKERGTGFQYSHHQPCRQIENVLVFYKKMPYYDYKGEKLEKPVFYALPVVKSGSSMVSSKNVDENGNRIYKKYEYKTKNNLLSFSRDNNKVHPTQKPVALLEYLIKTYTNENDTVLDNCAGSMSTAIACLNTNRNGIMIEKDEHYFEVGCKRIKHYILDNNINLCYNQVKGGVIWQNLKIG